MATILLAWELGGGLGHLTLLRPLARRLVDRGHHVVAVLRDLAHAETALAGIGVAYLQAPTKHANGPCHIDKPAGFAQLLHNVAFGHLPELTALAGSWRTIYEYVRPDLVVFDHSPTAMLASRGLDLKRMLFGMGFSCPPTNGTLPDFRPWLRTSPDKLLAQEELVLAHANDVLSQWQLEPLRVLSDLYSQVDGLLLTTFEELDHFGPRPQVRYWGVCPHGIGDPPRWPSGNGARVYAYLKQFQHLPHLLQSLTELKLPTIICADGIDPRIQKHFGSANIKFETRPVDLRVAGAQCDLAVLNATHGTTAAMLMAGKPILQLPIYLEQALIAKRMLQLGAGVAVNRTRPETFRTALEEVLSNGAYKSAANQFQEKYRDFDSMQQITEMASQLELLLVR